LLLYLLSHFIFLLIETDFAASTLKKKKKPERLALVNTDNTYQKPEESLPRKGDRLCLLEKLKEL
jgi:hypothetical protein